MHELFVDIEIFSPVNLAKTGIYPYADHDAFELLLFGYMIDGGPVEVVVLAFGHQLPDEVLAAQNPKLAHTQAAPRSAAQGTKHVAITPRIQRVRPFRGGGCESGPLSAFPNERWVLVG